VSGINIDWDVFGKDGAGIIRVNARVTTAPKPISTENHYTSEVSRANDEICYLITILCTANNTLTKCAFWFKRGTIPRICELFPSDSKSRAEIHSLLPRYLALLGPVVGVEEILDVADGTAAKCAQSEGTKEQRSL